MKGSVFLLAAILFFNCGGNGADADKDTDIQPDTIEDIFEEDFIIETEDLIDDSSEETEEITPVDEDEDGYYSYEDCDDTNPDIYPGVTRECSSDCNIGYEVCRDDATWSDCSASTDCSCSSPGSIETTSCGLCGTVERFCNSEGVWELRGECLDQGICIPGINSTLPCGNCGEVNAYCSEACQWVIDGECTSEGECRPGSVRSEKEGCEPGEIKGSFCTDSCQWEFDHDCSPDCIGEPRTGDFKDEICISGGPFLYGSDSGIGEMNEHPQRVIILSPYFIDKYPVTNARYKECVDSGVCNEPWYISGLITWGIPGYENYPLFGIDLEKARTFCEWDGGRLLPDEHHWEKAARGPYPREYLYPWGDNIPICGGPHVCKNDCGEGVTCPVGDHPFGASFYEVHDLMGPGFEWISGEIEHWLLPECSIDPTYGSSISPENLSVRGNRTSFREQRWNHDGHPDVGFRCARILITLDPHPFEECELTVPE